MSAAIAAVVFDAFGTLLTLEHRAFARDASRAVGADRRAWAAVLRELLTRSFETTDALLAHVCSRFPDAGPAACDALAASLAAELGSARMLSGARSVPAFLRRRGLRLGLLSNASSAHRDLVAGLGLLAPMEACLWSCDEARVKPEPELYQEACRRLGAVPSATLMIGDSLHNDVEAARREGLHALHVGGGDLGGVAGLAFRDVEGGPPFRELLPAGTEVELDGARHRLEQITLLPEAEQGRYNLVGLGQASHDSGATRSLYVKRFLHPEAVRVEELMHRLHAVAGVSVCQVAITGGAEPCLVATPAPGVRLGHEPPTPELSFELGRHCALGYLLANADLRPRNAFVHRAAGGPVVTMIDLEHGLFNLALDADGIDDPLDPRAWDAHPDDELRARVRRRVLTSRTTRRARQTFLADDDRDSACGSAFHEGWTALYRHAQAAREDLLGTLTERVRAEPPLVVGTLGHRRAFCNIDVVDVADRIGQDPEQVFSQCY